MTGEPEADVFQGDPITEPLTYPGRIPVGSGILIDGSFHRLWAANGTEPERWPSSSTTLAGLIEQHGSTPMSDRVPVVAVGSNASPGQLLRKFHGKTVRPVIPMTLAEVSHLVAGVSAHVSRPGYIPAVPVKDPGAISRVFVLWLDDSQLGILDETEPNYWRRSLPPASFPVVLSSGVSAQGCHIYVGKHGCLINGQGQPRRLGDQRTLIEDLLNESAQLRHLCGETAESFVARAQEPAVREAVQEILAAEGRVSMQPDLVQLPEELLPGGRGWAPAQRLPVNSRLLA